MYFLNAVVFYGGAMLVVALLVMVWRQFSKTAEMKTAADALMKVALVWCATFLVLGSILALTAAPAHANCKQAEVSGKDITGCQYFFDHWGH